MHKIKTKTEAYKLLDDLQAPDHLKLHAKLVGEAADLLIEKFEKLNLETVKVF